MVVIVYFGPMFSGKTSKLRSDAHMYAATFGKKCLLLNSKKDDRSFMTHSGAEFPLRSEYKQVDDLNEVKEMGLDYDVILLDEAHFVHHLYDVVRFWHEAGKTVVVAGLVTRFDGEAIGDIPSLNHLAETYMQFKAKCVECSKDNKVVDASFSKRLVAGDSEVLVGGSESYIAVCSSHFSTPLPDTSTGIIQLIMGSGKAKESVKKLHTIDNNTSNSLIQLIMSSCKSKSSHEGECDIRVSEIDLGTSEEQSIKSKDLIIAEQSIRVIEMYCNTELASRNIPVENNTNVLEVKTGFCKVEDTTQFTGDDTHPHTCDC